MKTIIAATLGMTPSELDEYRYHSTRTGRAIYAVGDVYVAAGKKPPTEDVGASWERHPDQFWADGKTTIWWAKI